MNIQVTNRTLLRNYKDLKQKLKNGEAQNLIVPQTDGTVLKISIEKAKTPYEKMGELREKYSFKNLKRPKEDII